MVIVFVPGACVASGVHVNNPLVGLMVAPSGGLPLKLNVSCCAGMSGSVAVAVNEIVCPAKTMRFVIAASVGGRFVASERAFAGSLPKSNSSRSR